MWRRRVMWRRTSTVALRACGVHRPNDVREQLLAEVRRDLGRLDVGLDFVEVLQPQDVVVGEIGNDPREEEAELLEAGTEEARAGMRQRQVDTDPVDPLQAQVAQARADEVRQVRSV